MRTPDEMAKSVLARRDRHFEEAARRKKAAVRTMSGIASCMCVMVIVFVMFLNTNRNKQGKKVDADLDPGTTCSASDDSTSEPDSSDDPYADTETTDIKTDTSKEKEGETAGPADTEKNDSETTSKPDPKDTSHISDPKNDPQTTKPDYTTGKPDDTSKSPDDTTSKPDDTSKSPDDTTSKPDDTSKSPDDTTEKPDDTTSKPDDPVPVFEFEIPDCSKDIMLRSDLQTYIIPGQGGSSTHTTITSVIENRCDFHLNPYYHYVPKYLMDKVNISQYVKAIKYEMGICGYEFNLMGFLTFYNFSDAELADWYYLNGGYHIYNIPFEIILARDEYAFADYYSVIDDDADGKMLYLEKLLAEEEMKKILLENLSRSDRENDKRAYALFTDNGKKLTGYNFSIADLIFESDFTVKDVERFIGQYKALNKATRKVFDYDLSVIDEKNRTVKGKTSGMYPCEVDALLHK